MILTQNKIRVYISPLIYFLILFTLLDNYLLEIFEFKTKLDDLLLLLLNFAFLSYLTRKVFITYKLSYLEFLLVLFFIVLGVSSTVNYNTGILQKILGSYYLVKSLNLFYLIYRFGISIKWIHRIFQLIIYIAILSVVVQIIQYIIPNINSLTGGLIPAPYVTDNFIRCSGILGAPNRTAQLFIIAYIVNRLLGNGIFHYRTLLFIIGLFLASSNLNLFSFFLVLLFDIMKNNKKLILPFTLIITIGLLYFGESFIFRLNQLYELAYVNESYFRLFAFLNSLEVLSNNVFFGVGPGMYGGSVSAIMGSPIYEQYDTFSYYVNSQHMPSTIDMFWPHLWAESGLLGALFFLLIFLLIFKKNLSSLRTEFYLLNLMIVVFLFSGISTFSVESTFSSVIVYAIIGSIMYWRKRNVYIWKS